MRHFALALTAITLWPAITFAQTPPQAVPVQPQIMEIEAIFGDCPVSSDNAGRPVKRSCLDDLYKIAREECSRRGWSNGYPSRISGSPPTLLTRISCLP
ncbi:MAG: hypothetical protein ACLPKB_21665 [Xanthobacteraceae bacterium]